MDKHLFTNRLINEKSPYLLQHAHNPVDWYPWSEEAFKAAISQDKPIFLSIGYATCHWCHTMEQESFEDTSIAESMNSTFICIKVDREELPEVDAIYMDFAQSMMAGSAGWPLNVLLTPQLEPFFAATYLPPFSRQGMLGLKDLIDKIRIIWSSEEREKVESQAEKIVEAFRENLVFSGEQLPLKEHVAQAADMLFKIADPIYGGLRGAPKFPVGYQYNFLLNYSSQSKEGRALFLTERTLDMMHRGGIYDHIGGGFSRYSVDERWQVPHFEKMLYDNALLAGSYVDAWRFTKKPLYKQVTLEILDYILRDMTHPEGGFYSGEDADSEGHEGYFYIWTYAEIEKILGPERAKLFTEFYDVLPEGNFEGSNVLNTPLGIEEFAAKYRLDPLQLNQELQADRKKLFEIREKRVHPFKDDKILTSWNGLMIHAMLEAGSAFQEMRYVKAAEKCVQFIRTQLWDGERLYRRFREGNVLHQGVLDDYAFLIRALLTLFEKGADVSYLEWALKLTDITQALFKAPEGAFYQSHAQEKGIILRKMQFSDGAEPSGNAVHGENLLRLYQLTGEEKYLQQAEDILRAVNNYLDNYSPGYLYHIMNISRYYDTQAPTFIIALNAQKEHLNALKKGLSEHYIPHAAIAFLSAGENLPFWKEYVPKQGKTTLYLCRARHCEEPITDIHRMIEAIQKG